METVKLPKGVKVYDQSGKCWRGEIPVSICPEKYLKPKGKKSDDKSTGTSRD